MAGSAQAAKTLSRGPVGCDTADHDWQNSSAVGQITTSDAALLSLRPLLGRVEGELKSKEIFETNQ